MLNDLNLKNKKNHIYINYCNRGITETPFFGPLNPMYLMSESSHFSQSILIIAIEASLKLKGHQLCRQSRSVSLTKLLILTRLAMLLSADYQNKMIRRNKASPYIVT